MENTWFDFSNVDNMYNNIVTKIINNQIVAKCLKYSSSDAIGKTNLTQDEQYLLIKQSNKETCRIFNIAPTYFVTNEQRAEIRVYETSIVANNPHIFEIAYCFDIVCHQDIWLLDDGSRRVMKIVDNIVKDLNGLDIGGIGKLRFFSPRKPEIFRVQFYNDNFAGYKLFGYITTGGSDERSC
jgi:hypothetical protein